VNNANKHELMRGHFEECFKHLRGRFLERFPKGAKGSCQAREPIVAFCKVNPQTSTSWFYRGLLPLGENYIRLVCYLDMLGYTVIELERMSAGRRGIFELIGFGVLTVDEAASSIGYDLPDLYRALWGRFNASDEKEQKMWDIWIARKAELQEIQASSRQKFKLNFPLGSNQTSLAIAPESLPTEPSLAHRELQQSEQRTEGEGTWPKMAVPKILEGIAQLIEGSPFDKLSDEDLESFQKIREEVLYLSAQLHVLSSKLILASHQKEVASAK